METRYYADFFGNYIGAFSGDTGISTMGMVEVPYPPEIATDVWDGTAWVPVI